MSAASTPVPRSKYSSDSRPSGSRHTLFWPMLIFLIGAGSLALYQVMAMEDQLDEVTQAIDKMDGKVKRAQYERAKFYAIVRDVLNLAPKDPNAQQVVTDFKLRQLQAAQPALMALSSGPPPPPALIQPDGSTNAAPAQPFPATNDVPELPTPPSAK